MMDDSFDSNGEVPEAESSRVDCGAYGTHRQVGSEGRCRPETGQEDRDEKEGKASVLSR